MNDLMNLTEAAKYLGVSLLTLRKLIKDHSLPTSPNPLDSRQKLVSRTALDALKARSGQDSELYFAPAEEVEGVLEVLADDETTDVYRDDILRMAAQILANAQSSKRASA